MFLLLATHLAVAALVLALSGRAARTAAAAGIAVLLTTAAVAVAWGVGDDGPVVDEWGWVPGLGLRLTLRLDGFAVLMVLLVAVLGALVLWYSVSYFAHDHAYGRFVGLFIAFAGAMTGLVLSADLFTMFVFWELTSVCSFLLIGLNDRSATARAAANRALLVTGAGGLCLLAGLTLFQVAAGTADFAELAARELDGRLVTVAAMLVLAGAFTKSAQFPFHFWLPGAMAAPTPVSAYLHSATMVKAGIVLMARMAPAVSDLAVWRWTVVIGGGVTMVLGGVRAMRQTDGKLLLAHSTVAQLGLLTVLVGIGVPGATYAGVAHLTAHAVFKAALFLSVGTVDHATGARDISELNGLFRRMPLIAAATTLAAASMAGLAPLLGFATKEKALVALLDADVGAAGVVALAMVIVGSVLSAAYSVRLVRGLFGRRHSADDTVIHHRTGAVLALPVVALATFSVVGGLAAGFVGRLVAAPAASLDATAKGTLLLWPGVGVPLAISLAVLAIGAIIGWRWPMDRRAVPPRVSGERIFQHVYDAMLVGSRRVTSVTQSGSLMLYLGVTMTVAAVAVVAGLAGGEWASPAHLLVADSVVEFAVVALGTVFALAIPLCGQRFIGALLLGGVGFACAVVFALFGAPDLAVTQVLIETLTIVVFLLVLRQMPRHFADDAQWLPQSVRVMIAAAVGASIAVFAVVAGGARSAPSAGDVYTARALSEAGGRNVVNVILVDFRGVDTMGEITVLAVAALGVANLVRMARRRGEAVPPGAALEVTTPPPGGHEGVPA